MKMNTAILVFTYNRSIHTQKVLDALKRNKITSEKLFIFQDGLKQESDKIEWLKVNAIIQKVNWCDVEIVVSDNNKGLALSIVTGINYAFEKFDTVIVLEDDCVPTINFIDFMNQCFLKYQNNKMVYSISGYSWPIMLKKSKYDIYGCGRISSWGWGTWKDRWIIYEKDYEIIKKMKQDMKKSKNLAIWGNDLEETLIGNIRGNSDSWAVFWALNVILQQGICINPYQSFIRNIGMDGSGVHCGISKQFDVDCIDEKRNIFYLPDEVHFLDEVAMAFAPFHGSYTAINEDSDNKINILLYGAGNFYLRNEKYINEKYYIKKFVDINKKGYFEGKRIIKPDEIKYCKFDKIIIMIQDKKKSIEVYNKLIKQYNIK